MNLDFLFFALIIGITGVIYRLILAYEPILNWWFMFGLRYEKRWFYKPVFGCEFCFAGQIAFWSYLINWVSIYFNGNAPFWRFIFFLIPEYNFKDYGVFWLVSFVCLAIFFAFIIGKFIERLKNGN